MDKAEKSFHLEKNNLDNEYSKILAYFQIFMVGLITLGIAVSVFLLQERNIIGVIQAISSSVFAAAASFVMFRNKLNDISMKISRLG